MKTFEEFAAKIEKQHTDLMAKFDKAREDGAPALSRFMSWQASDLHESACFVATIEDIRSWISGAPDSFVYEESLKKEAMKALTKPRRYSSSPSRNENDEFMRAFWIEALDPISGFLSHK